MAVVAIANHKGGTGKTTTAVNLSAGLARLKELRPAKTAEGSVPHPKILVIDMDPQANASMHLIPKAMRLSIDKLPNIVDVFDGKPVLSCIIPTDYPNLAILPASIDMFNLEQKIINSASAVDGLRAVLTPEARKEYEIIIIDSPPNLGTFMMNSLVAADSYIIPIESESIYALHGMKALQAKIEDVQRIVNPNLKLLGCLITKYDGRTTAARIVLDMIKKHFGDNVFKTVIRKNTDINKAAILKKPIFEVNQQTYGARDYYNLSEEVAEKTGFEFKKIVREASADEKEETLEETAPASEQTESLPSSATNAPPEAQPHIEKVN